METSKVGSYKHFKGSIYQKVGIGIHSEDGSEFVIYYNILNPKKIYLRPVDLFESMVKVDGVDVPRFQFISESKPILDGYYEPAGLLDK